MEPKVKVRCFSNGAISSISDPFWWWPVRITCEDYAACSTETWKAIRHVSRFEWRATQVLTRIDGGKLAAAPGQTLDSAGEIFAWQHDPEQVGPDTFTYFDNESSGTPLLPYSRTVTVRLNYWDKTATLVASANQPEGLSAASQGNAQTTRNGDQFVGWGALPYFSEFSPSGQLEFNAGLPAGVNTYRAYRLAWFPAPHRW